MLFCPLLVLPVSFAVTFEHANGAAAAMSELTEATCLDGCHCAFPRAGAATQWYSCCLRSDIQFLERVSDAICS